jgi:lysophospholipase L1-like esterase
MRAITRFGGQIVFTLGPTTTGSGPVAKDYAAFGDSIAAGYKDGTFPGQIKSYVGYYADSAAASQSWTITYRGYTTSGETTSQIEARMRNNLSALRSAEIISWDAGGNDFLDARSDFYGNCNLGALDTALANWRADWDVLLDTVEANGGTTADSAPKFVTMNVYYPNPAKDASQSCNGRTRYEHLLPRLLAAGDYMCSTAESRGWRCADTFAAMNCAEDASGNPDFNCPNKRYLQNLVDSGICPRSVPGGAPYSEPSIDPNCIRDHLDATGDWGAFYDPAAVPKNGVVKDYMQGDDTHPNAAGHQAIAAAHHQLGYDDVQGNQVENSYALCIDYQDNDGDGQDDCDDSDCAAFCP